MAYTKITDLEISEEDSKIYAATHGRGVFVSDIARKSSLPANDIRMISVTAPSNGIIHTSGSITPKITFKNQGTENVTNVTISYSFNGKNVKNKNWTGSLESEQTIEIELPTENLAIGSYELDVTTNINNDSYATNNNLKKIFFVNTFNEVPTKINSFENREDALLSQNNMWERGTVRKDLLKTPSGNKAYATKLVGK